MTKEFAHDSVLIIGNGFDKNCGLKTGYSDVYTEYIKIPSDSKVIQEFKNNIGSNHENWSDFELGMALYANNFEKEEDFIECLNDFSAFMNSYLSKVQKEFMDEWDNMRTHESMEKEFRSSINELGSGVTHNVDDMLFARRTPDISSLGFISLNYTDIFDLLLKSSYPRYDPFKPIHIHGKLDDDPLLGMDRVEQLVVRFDITERVKRHFLKPIFNQEYDYKRVHRASSLIRGAKTIFLYGASMGESDLSWRELLSQWLKDSSEHHLFIYEYKNSQKSFATVNARLDYERAEKNRLFSDWGIEKEDALDNQVHLPCGKNLFNIGDAKHKDITLNKTSDPKITGAELSIGDKRIKLI